MTNRSYKSQSRLFSLILFVVLLLPGVGKASWLTENDVALGIEAGNLNSGFSARFPYKSNSSWQLTVGGGSANSIGGRYIAHFDEWNDSRLYWYGGLSAWFWGGDFFNDSEFAIGFSGGIGLDYDLDKLDDITVPVSISFTIGPSYAAFSNFRGLDLLNLGLGIHYRFE